MENEYLKIYNYFFNKTIKSTEKIFKVLLIKNKKQGRNFNNFHNKTTSKIYELSTNKFYINTSNKFNDIIRAYDNRYSFYDDKFTNLIFANELLENFTSIKDVKKDYTFKKCIAELAQINGLKEAHSRLQKTYNLLEIMYKLNDFSEFELWSDNTGIEGSKFYEKYRNKLYPPAIIDKTNINFEIKEEHKDLFTDTYLKFIKNHIDETKTTKQDFINVFTKSTDKHDSKIYFFCRTPEVWLLIKELKFAFKKLTLKNVENSTCFISSDGNILTQTNLSRESCYLKSGKNEFDEKLFDEATRNIKMITKSFKNS